MANITTIAICVATYKRPAMLKQCLSAINMLERLDNYKTITIVVDNDIGQSGQTVTHNADKDFSGLFYYAVEPERGIASARNRLLEEALKQEVDLIAFLDDDEFPKANWLETLFQTLEKYNADVVTGPIISLNEEGHIISTTEDKYSTGRSPRKVSTNNVLFKKGLILNDRLRFDLKLNFTGGEDFDFFERSKNKGDFHVWTNEAVVYETTPKERTTRSYLFFRHFTGAINNVIQYKIRHGHIKTWTHFSLKVFGKFFGAILMLIAYLFTLKIERINKSIVKIASSIGYFCGLLNIVVERYR